MLTSRNPQGEIEAYTDIGQFIGILPPDYPGLDLGEYADDGGPGSGNWGHKGRPGKRGGSGKGGGKRYRGGRSDVRFVGARKDWLNGLSGERQLEAARFLTKNKRDLRSRQLMKSKLEDLAKKGMISPEDAQERIKEANVGNIRENMTAEEYVMENGSMKNKSKLLELASEARSWGEFKNQYKKENLTEDETKIFDYMEANFPTLDDTGINSYMELKAKAMGLIEKTGEIPDEIQYEAGTKERPAPPEPPAQEETGEANYDWYSPGSYNGMINYMMEAVGDQGSWGARYSKDDVIAANQKFIDTVKSGKMKPNGLLYYGMGAIASMRRQVEEGGKLPTMQEQIAKLGENEKKFMLDFVNRYSASNSFDPVDKFSSIDEITNDDFEKVELKLQRLNANFYRSNAAQQQLRDYILLQERMMINAKPTSQEDLAEREEAARRAEAEKARQEEERRKEMQNTPQAQKEREEAAKMRQARESGEKVRAMGSSFELGVGLSHYEKVAKAVDECDNIDAQVMWDLYGVNVKVATAEAGKSQFYRPSTKEISIDNARNEAGDAYHAPLQTVFHEVGHAIDYAAAEKFGYKETFSLGWNNGEFCDTIEAEAKSFMTKIGDIAKAEFKEKASQRDDPEWYKFVEKYYRRGSREHYEVWSGKKEAKWSVTTRNNAVANHLKNLPDMAEGAISDTIMGATRGKVIAGIGHYGTYYKGQDARLNMATECFANLYGTMVRNKEAYNMMRKEFPKTVACFERMIKEIAERG